MSQRDLTSAMQTELRAGWVIPIILVEVEFLNGPVRMWSGSGLITWNGYIWTGAADGNGNMIGQIEGLAESTSVEARQVVLSLSGIPSELIPLAMNETRQGKPANIWLGMLDAAHTVIADPAQILRGAVDVPSFEDSGTTSTISITIESRRVDGKRARERRYTDQDQQGRFPSDRAMEYVPQVQLWNGMWGRAGAAGASAGGGSTGGVAGCWSPESLVKTPTGVVFFERYAGEMVRSKSGIWQLPEELLVREYEGPLHLVPGVGRVTPEQPLDVNGEWVRADQIYLETVDYVGPVYNFRINAETFDERSYEMAGDIVAHNKLAEPDR